MSYKDNALAILRVLLDDPTSEHGRALRLIVLEQIQKRAKHRQRIVTGLERARSRGVRLGRPRQYPSSLPDGMTVRQQAKAWGVSKSTAHRWSRQLAM